MAIVFSPDDAAILNTRSHDVARYHHAALAAEAYLSPSLEIDWMAARCGLQPPDLFERKQRKDLRRWRSVMSWRLGTKVKIDKNQRTGRTTKMLLQALIAIEKGNREIAIVGHMKGYADELKRRLFRMADRAGVDLEEVEIIAASNQRGRSRFARNFAAQRFVDHYAEEHARLKRRVADAYGSDL